jgi:hypothetical protein
MAWVTIYDVRTSWGFWFQVVVGAFWLGVSLWLAYVLVFRKPAATQVRRPIVVLLVIIPANVAIACLFLWGALTDYRDRSDLNAGRFSEIEDVIEAINFVNSGRSTTMYIRLGQSWFQVPYGHPRDCWPHLGELVRLEYRPVEDQRMWSGLPTYSVLRMDSTHRCRIVVWG